MRRSGRHAAGVHGAGAAEPTRRQDPLAAVAAADRMSAPLGGGMRAHAGGGGGMRARAGGGGLPRRRRWRLPRRRRWRGGGRRSDIRLKHDIVYLGRLDDGLGFYRFSYNGSDRAYVGVMAQDVQSVMPQAVFAGRDGYLRVNYQKLGLTFETYGRGSERGHKFRPRCGLRIDRRTSRATMGP